MEFLSQLIQIVPPDRVLQRESQLRPFECDGLVLYRALPRAVVLAETEEEVSKVLALCHRENIPVVARGAGTGLSGGATPHPEGIVLSLARFHRIMNIDVQAQTATVECGVRNLAISEAVAPYGLYYAPDPSSQIACTIGGNVAENAGGVHCLKYGLTLHNVLRLRGYTADGALIECGALTPESPEPSLVPLLVGSEGMLAVITQITVKLTPKPQAARCILASFVTVVDAAKAVATLIAEGFIPAGLEMMDKPMTRAVEDFVHAGYDLDAVAILLCESDGTDLEVEDEIRAMTEVLQRVGASKIAISQSEEGRLRFWSGRKNAFPASGRISPDYLCMDSTIPRRHLADILLAIERMEQKYGLRCCNVFHAGDGNLHPLILFDGNDATQARNAELFGAEILELSVAMGGTISGEHGVGLEKLNSMCVQFTPEEREQMEAVKFALDEKGILNPGKVIPSLNRCAEYGKMVVRNNRIPFPELERF